MAEHFLRRKRLQQVSTQIGFALVVIQPQLVIFGVENDGHPVMHGPKHVVGFGRQDSAGFDDGPFTPLPAIPQPREAERLLVPQSEEVRLFLAPARAHS